MRFAVLFCLFAVLVSGIALWCNRAAPQAAQRPLPKIMPSQKMEDSTSRTAVALTAEQRLRSRFARARQSFPPKNLALLIFKAERKMELWSNSASDGWQKIHDYPILAASGTAGPKLREGDRQVPEGIYRISAMNPKSKFHLSLKMDYPNAYDQARARDEGRTNLGGDIFIHGGEQSIGCVAIGDPAIEEIYHAVSKVDRAAVTVISAPADLRDGRPRVFLIEHRKWYAELHQMIERELRAFTSAR